MNAQLIQLSVVVVGKAHNPTILNPDFLALRGIVPPDWGWEVDETITTPPFAIVRYKSGVAVNVEPNKLQVTDMLADADPTQSKAAEVAEAYVVTLPHVRYTAVGLNFHSVIEVDSPETYLKKRFLKKGKWDSPSHSVVAAGFRLVYAVAPTGRVTLSLDAGEVQKAGSKDTKSSVIIANANFHRTCSDYPAEGQVCEYLHQLRSDWSMYQTLIADVLEAEE
ncbi:MAG: hypothetical protein JXA69_02740 [Phycisphaerae bacterium]|nr:hypothetical protein [Phycisphaerae bacterium]